MLTRIISNSDELCTFVDQLNLPLSAPQLRHVINVADGLLVTDGRKTIAEIRRQFVSCVDPSNIADTFRIAPWLAKDIQASLAKILIQIALTRLEEQDQPRCLLISLDDSLLIKDPDTRHLEGVDWHYDHAARRRKRTRYQNALCYLEGNVTVGDWSATVAIHPYLRGKTVRSINRHRPPGQRVHFVSKYRLARRILEDCRELIPPDVAVYVQFDIWYSSARLIKYIRRQGWHVICRVKSNRKLSDQSIKQRGLAQRHQRCSHVGITAADGSKTTYLVRRIVGRLSKIPFDVCGLVSRRHYRDHHPVYFISTDLTLSPQQALQWYARRWNCEIDNFYLKQRLGLGDFRLQSYEGIDKFCSVVLLAWAYVKWRYARTMSRHVRNPADVIRQHRYEHAQKWLTAACQEAIDSRDIPSVIKRFLPRGP